MAKSTLTIVQFTSSNRVEETICYITNNICVKNHQRLTMTTKIQQFISSRVFFGIFFRTMYFFNILVGQWNKPKFIARKTSQTKQLIFSSYLKTLGAAVGMEYKIQVKLIDSTEVKLLNKWFFPDTQNLWMETQMKLSNQPKCKSETVFWLASGITKLTVWKGIECIWCKSKYTCPHQ